MKTLLVLCLAALAAGAQNAPAPGPAPAQPLALLPPPAAAPEPPDPNDPLDEAPPPKVHKGYSVRKKITAPPPPGEPADVLFEGGANGDDAGGFGASFVGAGGARADFFRPDFAYARGGKAARSVVIESREPDPNAIATVEEDLNVMSRILEKAIAPSQDETKRVMGIEVHSLFGPAAGARNLYLEGYGAVFLLNVDFPLLAPPEGKTEARPKEPASSEWEDARQELYGNPLQRQFEPSWAKAARGKAEPYDPEKVEGLKTSLLDGLKNATHIRSLKPDEAIVVVVTGPGSGRPATARGMSALPATPSTAGPGAHAAKAGGLARAGRERATTAASRGDTIMTVRVKKADVDAFAQGKLDANEFRKKAKLFVYAKPSEPLAGGAVWPAPAVHGIVRFRSPSLVSAQTAKRPRIVDICGCVRHCSL